MPQSQFQIGMEPSMLDRVDKEASKHGMSRAGYIRHCVRQATDSPFDEPETELYRDENGSIDENSTADESEGAA